MDPPPPPPQLPFKLNRPELLPQASWISNRPQPSSASGLRFAITDPGTGLPFASAPSNSGPGPDVDSAVASCHAAFLSYRSSVPSSRASCLRRWSALLEANKEDLAAIVTHETGKPAAESRGEVDYGISSASWFAGEAERIQGSYYDGFVPGKKVVTVRQPVGVVAALVPWNFPVAMLVRKAAAALAAGCTMVVKPSPETPLSAVALAVLAAEAGFPPGALNVLTTSMEDTPALSEALCRHELVKKVTFTGSTRVGKLVAKICSDGLKKVTLELGGNCPFVVFDDADLNQAVDALTSLKWRNSGQACISANRVYVQSAVYDRFAALVVDRASQLVVGHGWPSTATATSSETTPAAAETETSKPPPPSTLGPVTTPHARDRLVALVADATAKGAKVLLGGGEQPKGKGGYFFRPTVLGDVTREMRIADDEIFGPVLTLYRFDGEEEAVAAANDTPMGLASYVFTKNLDRAWRLLYSLEAGMIGLNTSIISGAETPFGGMKESGYGKEAGKDVAVDEYLVTKAVSMAIDSRL